MTAAVAYLTHEERLAVIAAAAERFRSSCRYLVKDAAGHALRHTRELTTAFRTLALLPSGCQIFRVGEARPLTQPSVAMSPQAFDAFVARVTGAAVVDDDDDPSEADDENLDAEELPEGGEG